MSDVLNNLVQCPFCLQHTFNGSYDHEIYILNGTLTCTGKDAKR